MHSWMGMALLAATMQQAVVVKPVANMYAQPSEDAEVVSQAIYGSTVSALEERPGWLRVRTPDEYTGWMALASLHRFASGEKPYASSGRVVRIESLFANIYREADVTKHQALVTVPFETRLEVQSQPAADERWIEVRLPDGGAGWVQRGDTSSDTQPLSIAAAIELGRRFLGVTYTWGGTSSFGYDCSGFTQMLCRRRGVLMPRDASQQAAWQGAVAVRREDLQPGDLLFFGRNADHITHTGMYIGNGEFINATTWVQPVVQISKLSDPHWSHLLVACRRLP